MPHRNSLIDELRAYHTTDSNEAVMHDKLLAFVTTEPDCFKRELAKGHITGSAWVLNAARTKVILLFHATLNRWLQPGGHSDGESLTWQVARREAFEETGIPLVDLHLQKYSGCRIFDIDIHEIPTRKDEAAHLHYDLRFLFHARSETLAPPPTESQRLAWVELTEIVSEESVMRMVQKSLLLDS